jgi:hypothetical protein
VILLIAVSYRIGFYKGAEKGIDATMSFFESEINTMKSTGIPAFKFISEINDTSTYYINKEEILKTADE